jgi:hypothetical protein
VADFADRAVAVVGGDVDHDGDAAGSVTFENHFFDLPAFEFSGAALDGALDVVGGHADCLGRQDGGSQARVGVGIAATAGSNHDLLDDAGEHLAPLGVESGLLMFDGRPL